MQLIEQPIGWVGPWNKDMIRVSRTQSWSPRVLMLLIQFLHILAETCQRLCTLPGNMKDVSTFDVSRLRWDPRVNPWFPVTCEHDETAADPDAKCQNMEPQAVSL